jgi:hypothetical protein
MKTFLRPMRSDNTRAIGTVMSTPNACKVPIHGSELGK